MRNWIIPFLLGILLISQPTASAADGQIDCTLGRITPATTSEPTIALLSCDLERDGQADDSLLLVDRNADMPLGEVPWQELGDTSADRWIFDRRGDGQAELVIDFQREGGALVARLYDRVGAKLGIAYNPKSGALELPPWPRLTISAPAGWWVRDGQVNMNIQISVDGFLNAAYDLPSSLAAVFRTDGVTDITVQIRDSDNDGYADYDWRSLHFADPPPLIARQVQHSFLMVNVRDDEARIAPELPFPYVGGLSYGYLTSSPHTTTPPPVQIDWAQGMITAVGEFVSSRGNDGQYFVYSAEPLVAGALNAPNFESPFAWYDLAEDRDRQAELALRVVYYPPDDEGFSGGALTYPTNMLRYSWDQDNDGFWDYKLGMIGTHLISSTVELPELAMTALSYDEAPRWAIKQPWHTVFFVEADTQAQGEGIYVWDPPPWMFDRYLAGRLGLPPAYDPLMADLAKIPVGYRGEYRLASDGPIRLYLSPIDHRLHLRHAEAGLWQIDDRRQLRSADHDGDGYIDQWTVFVDGQQAGQLNRSNSHVLLTEGDELVIKAAAAPVAPADILPPTNHAEWKVLGAEIAAIEKPNFSSDDLRAMLTQFAGQESRLQGVTVRDFRPEGAGFHFVMTVGANYRPLGKPLPGFLSLKAGDYFVRYDGTYKIALLQPPTVRLAVAAQPLRPLMASEVAVTIHNDGPSDVSEGLLELRAAADGAAASIFFTQTISLPAGAQQIISVNWPTPMATSWQITADLHDRAGAELAKAVHQQNIQIAKQSSDAAIANDPLTPQSLIALSLLASAAACLGLLTWFISGEEQGEEHR